MRKRTPRKAGRPTPWAQPPPFGPLVVRVSTAAQLVAPDVAVEADR